MCRGVELRFGELDERTEKAVDEDGYEVKHIGSGLTGIVSQLSRGRKYV